MSYLDKVRKIPINGREVEFCWTFDSMVALEQSYGITRDNFALKFKEAVGAGQVFGFYQKLLFCGTRSAEQPPTLKEIGRMDMAEVAEARRLMDEAMTASANGGVPAGKDNAADPGAAGASGGTGGPRSSRRSTAAESRRKRSGA